jgi:hypothetical protein
MPRRAFQLRKREIIAAALLLLPPLLLIPLGVVWLWQQGHGLWFFALCLLAAMPAGVFVLRWRRPPPQTDLTELVAPDSDWPARERNAFEKVRRLAETVEPLSLTGADEAFALARRVVEHVARHYRPEDDNPLAAFTMPEGLLLVQRVSARLRQAVLEMVPLADRLTLAQLRSAHDLVGKASPLVELGRDVYDLYRAVRPVINPASAALGEARRLIFDAAWDAGKARLQRRLTELLVLEVGKAAIDLYSGRLRHDSEEVERVAAATARADAVAREAAAPLRVLIAGQTNAGKSSLLNALARDILAPVTPLPGPSGFRAFEATDPEGSGFVFVDAPGLDTSPAAIAALAEEARRADIVLWTIAVTQAAREADARGFAAFREWFAARPELNRPPLLCVATHIDQLRPFAEWAPPYDIVAADRPKARAIRDAVEAIAAELALSPASVVPVSLAPGRDPYNLDALRARIAASLPEARYAQLARVHAALVTTDWRKELERVVRAGRALFGAS